MNEFCDVISRRNCNVCTHYWEISFPHLANWIFVHAHQHLLAFHFRFSNEYNANDIDSSILFANTVLRVLRCLLVDAVVKVVDWQMWFTSIYYVQRTLYISVDNLTLPFILKENISFNRATSQFNLIENVYCCCCLYKCLPCRCYVSIEWEMWIWNRTVRARV